MIVWWKALIVVLCAIAFVGVVVWLLFDALMGDEVAIEMAEFEDELAELLDEETTR